MKYILLIIIVFISLSNVYGQSITWQRLYSGPSGRQFDEGWDICSTRNGNFYLLGNHRDFQNNVRRLIIKINKYGDTLWSRTIDTGGSSYTITSSFDGGCTATGSGMIVKLDSAGNFQWGRYYGITNNFIQHYDIIQTLDSGYIMCGRNVGSGIYGYVIRIGKNGEYLWQKTYNLSENCVFNKIIQENENFLICGIKQMYNEYYAIIIKLNNSGDTIWEKEFSVLNFTVAECIEKINNGYIISGSTFNDLYNTGRAFFIRTDTSGNITFTKVYPNVEDGYFNYLKVINENKYVYVVTRDSIGTNNLVITDIRTIDSSGNLLNQKNYMYGDYAEIREIIPLPSGDIIMAGVVETPYPDKTFIYAIRTDSLLNSRPIGIQGNINIIPENSFLYQNHPNPFNPTTTIKYHIPQDGMIEFKVYDIQGREIFYYNGYKQQGEYEYEFDGSKLASGVYFYQLTLRLRSGNEMNLTKKMVLMK